MGSWSYNPEKRVWRGKSYKKGGRRIRALRDAVARAVDLRKEPMIAENAVPCPK